ncbi:MAG TPA: DUF1206 domain-containing protein [Gaiellaceae bacterium]|nr:DUF1206 domain-containing protein [Gaiellaceae bacterium]
MTEHAAASPWIERSARFGLATKGFSYLVVAVIALKVALGGGGQAEDRQGALRTLADEPFGWLLLLLVALGFAAYALWRVLTAVLDRDEDGDDAKGIGKRLGDFARGVVYAGLAVGTASIVLGGGGSGGGDEEQATAVVLDLPLGRWLVGAAGLAVVGIGLFNGYRAVTGSFRDDLREEAMDGTARPWYISLGVFGHLARGAVFVLIGFFLLKAAWEYDPDEAVGLDGALQTLAGEAYGTVLLAAAAIGLAAYGLFCLVQARYRDV